MSDRKYISENPPLLTLFLMGIASTLVGLLVWFNATGTDYGEEIDVGAQFIGSALISFGTLLLVLGLAVAAVLRHLVDTEKRNTKRAKRQTDDT